ncbi:MAG: helix-turn-helix domain-containing protein [Lacinutrix venerupis]
MNNLVFKIKQCRERQGFSQEFVAEKLKITQSSYAKLESGVVKITLDRLQKITEILELDINELINSKEQQIFNLYNNKEAVGQNIIENLYEYNKEAISLLIVEKDKRIENLEKEILFLRNQLTK